MCALRLDSLIDLQRYPVDALHTPDGRELVETHRTQLRDRGLSQLHGFLRPSAVESLVAEAGSISQLAYFGLTEASPYYSDHDDSLPEDHPRNIQTPRELGLVAADQIPQESALHVLYESDDLHRFLGAVLEKETIYPFADPYEKIALTFMPEGAGQNWHFDDADFTITLLLRPPRRGGNFECVPKLRTGTDENYDGVREVLRGRRDNVQVIGFEPGTLMIFRGANSLHRVSPVQGDISRVVAIFVYGDRPNLKGSPEIYGKWYGPRLADHVPDYTGPSPGLSKRSSGSNVGRDL